VLSQGRSRHTFWLVNFVAVVLGILVGSTLAFLIGLSAQRRAARAELRLYTPGVLSAVERVGYETRTTLKEIQSDDLEFCSDAELLFMRQQLFRSVLIRDIGRTRDGKLYCTTGRGRLTVALTRDLPDFQFENRLLFRDIPLAIYPGSAGEVVESNGVSLVYSRDFFATLDHPPVFYTAFIVNRAKRQVFALYGPNVPLSVDDILTDKLVERDGELYEAMCSEQYPGCVVGRLSVSEWAKQHEEFIFDSQIAGGLLGAALAVIFLQFYQTRSMEVELRRAVRRGALRLVYQPIVDLTTGKIVAAEALLRWSRRGRDVPPDVFIALAERRHFISVLTQWVVRNVIVELGSTIDERRIRVTVNIASEDLKDSAFPTFLTDCLRTAGLTADRIGLELTERSAAEGTSAAKAIGLLQSLGHPIYIDDFGTGYSSLSYLHRLSPDAIKMDQSFTQTIGTEAITAPVVPLILEMASKLNMLIVVEGIETREQADYFTAASPNGSPVWGQGWFFGKPMTASDLRSMLARGSAQTDEEGHASKRGIKAEDRNVIRD
jgi:sensor c-di-GMP phosphodiesterase-like protein